MPAADTLIAFAGASLLLIVMPGPAVIYVVSRSVQQGREAGLISMLGIEAGNLTQGLAAAVGLSALVASSATAFTVVKFAGAAYLIYLGLRALAQGGESLPGAEAAASSRSLFLWGYLVALLNPKTALFFLAFLPQFVDPSRGSVGIQIAVMGACFTLIAVVCDGAYALLAGTAGGRLRRAWSAARVNRASGLIYIGLGLSAALSHGRPSRS